DDVKRPDDTYHRTGSHPDGEHRADGYAQAQGAAGLFGEALQIIVEQSDDARPNHESQDLHLLLELGGGSDQAIKRQYCGKRWKQRENSQKRDAGGNEKNMIVQNLPVDTA